MPIKLKSGVVASMPVADLERDPKQPRKTFNDETLKGLAESLKVRQEEPIKVRQEGKRTIIVDGERRWRAAKLAKLKTVEVLLDERTDLIDIAATQLTTAVQREQLSPLDIAEFLTDLQKREKATTNTLLAALAARGIKEIGPAKLERIMRLVELPDWAKEWMREGIFGEGHGQAVLAAAKFPQVLKQVKESVGRDLKWKGGVTVREVEQDVEQAFRMAGTDLNNKYGDDKDIRQFPIEQCRSCEFYKKIGGGEYCLNRKLFDKKQNEALLLKAEREAKKAERDASKKKGKAADDVDQTDPTKVEPRKVKLNENNVVVLKRMSYDVRRSLADASFDQGQCKTCPHRHLASHDGKTEGAEDHCFHPPCYEAKDKADSRAESRRGKMREYLEAWLRPIVVREAPKRLKAVEQQAILVWLATGAVDRGSSFWGGQMHEKAARATQAFLAQNKLQTLPELFEFVTTKWAPQHVAQLVGQSIAVMTREQLRWLALAIKIDLNDPAFAYRVDEAYLRMKRKGELQQLWKDSGCESDISNLGAGELRTWCLEANAREKIGVPADLERLYREEFREDPDDDIDADDLMDGTVCIGCGCTHMDPCEEGCAWVVQDDRRSYMSSQPAVGVCSAQACAPHMERWRKGDRTLSPEAKARHEERRAMLQGDDDELDAAAEDLEESLEEEAPRKARRKRA